MNSFYLCLIVLFAITLSAWLYTMFVYPLLMALIGWLVPSPVIGTVSSWPTVTLIIPAHNEEAVISAKLANTATIDYPHDKLEIIVVSDGSHDQTVNLARKHHDSRLRIMDFRERRGKTSIVNDAVTQATGEILCLCDANVMFRPDALQRMVSRLTDQSVGAVSGDVRLKSEESDFGAGEGLYYRFERAMQVGESVVGSIIGVDGGMYVIRKALFQPPQPNTILDDFVISMQVVIAGRRVVYERLAVADENATPSSDIEYRRRIRVMAGAMQTLNGRLWPSPLRNTVAFWQWASHKLLRWLSPICLVVIFASSSLVALHFWQFKAIAAIQFLFYGLALAATLSKQVRKLPIAGICFYFCLSHVAMLVGIYRGLRGRQPVTWQRTQRTG